MGRKQSCCWGILGAADIARKNWQAIARSGNGHIKAVASRSSDRAAALISTCEKSVPFEQQVQPVEGYENLLADPKIDAVYIPLPTVVRDHWATAAIEAGKHVLIEKPCSTSAQQLRKIIDAAAARNLQVMDGVMFTHSKRFAGLMDAIHKERVVGDVRRIASQFTFCADSEWASSNIRCNSRFEPFGALGDLGWYSIRIALAAMGEKLPVQVIGRSLKTHQHPDADQSVPIEFDGTLIFEGNVTASLYCSFTAELQQWTNISGSEGQITIEDFVLPFHGRPPQFEIVKSRFNTETCDFIMHRQGQIVSFDETANSAADSQEAQLFRDFNNCVLSGTADSLWPKASINTQIVLDALLHSAKEDRPIELSNKE